VIAAPIPSSTSGQVRDKPWRFPVDERVRELVEAGDHVIVAVRDLGTDGVRRYGAVIDAVRDAGITTRRAAMTPS
jgi:hypothetical protein